MAVTDFGKAKARRATDSMEISVPALLRDLADQIDEGRIDALGVTVVILAATDNGNEVRVHRAQMSILEEAGLLTIAQIDSAHFS